MGMVLVMMVMMMIVLLLVVVLVVLVLIMISYQQDLPIDGRQGHEGQERVLGDHPKDV